LRQIPQTARAASGLIGTVEQRLGHPEKAAAAAQRVTTLPRDTPMPDPFVAETGALQTGMQAWLTQADLPAQERSQHRGARLE
jgi:hypothetical protein